MSKEQPYLKCWKRESQYSLCCTCNIELF